MKTGPCKECFAILFGRGGIEVDAPFGIVALT